jgi:hypothetical protein
MMPDEKPHRGFAASPDQMMQILSEIQTTGLGSLSWLGTAWVETMNGLGAEWLRFVSERVRADVETQHALLNARDLAEVQHIQAQFLQKAMDDYHDETGRIVEICSKAVADIQARAKKG